MPFAHDRDLLLFEPTLFRDVGWSAQRLLDADGASIAGTTLTTPKGDLAALGVDAGHVVTVDSTALEVVERLSATTLTVSRPRTAVGDPPIPPGDGLSGRLVIATFLPQIGLVHEQLLRSAGVEPADPERRPGEQDIVNGPALVRCEALGALHLVLSAAAAMVGPTSPMWTRAQLYRDRFNAERARATVEIDLDGDGRADATRRFNTIQFRRSAPPCCG